MTRKWKSACFASALVGLEQMASGPNKQDKFSGLNENLQQKSTKSPLLYAPKIIIPPEDQKRFKTLNHLMIDFRASFFNPKKHERLYYHLNPDNSLKRKCRAEFRTLTSVTCQIIMHYYDVASGEIGFRDKKGKWVPIGYKTLANKIGERESRIKKAFKFFKSHGWISVISSNRKKGDKIYGENARKIVNPQFFIETLGVKAWRRIKKLKDWIFKKAKPKESINQDNRDLIKQIWQGVTKSIPYTRSKRQVDNSIENERSLISKAMRLHQDNPSISMTDYLRMLKLKPC